MLECMRHGYSNGRFVWLVAMVVASLAAIPSTQAQIVGQAVVGEPFGVARFGGPAGPAAPTEAAGAGGAGVVGKGRPRLVPPPSINGRFRRW